MRRTITHTTCSVIGRVGAEVRFVISVLIALVWCALFLSAFFLVENTFYDGDAPKHFRNIALFIGVVIGVPLSLWPVRNALKDGLKKQKKP